MGGSRGADHSAWSRLSTGGGYYLSTGPVDNHSAWSSRVRVACVGRVWRDLTRRVVLGVGASCGVSCVCVPTVSGTLLERVLTRLGVWACWACARRVACVGRVWRVGRVVARRVVSYRVACCVACVGVWACECVRVALRARRVVPCCVVCVCVVPITTTRDTRLGVSRVACCVLCVVSSVLLRFRSVLSSRRYTHHTLLAMSCCHTHLSHTLVARTLGALRCFVLR